MNKNVIEHLFIYLFIYFSFHNMFGSQGPIFVFVTNFCTAVTQKNLSCKLYKGFFFFFSCLKKWPLPVVFRGKFI
jgi:hypothetical protein